MKKIINTFIFGEDHSPEERDRIENDIIKLKPDFILSEELGPFSYFSDKEILKGIEKKIYSISDRTFRLGLKLKVPIIGIDDWKKSTYSNDLKNIFRIRERKMFNTIKKYQNKTNGTIVVIVGDTHLRTIKTKELGSSSILYKLKNTKIIRSKNKEIK